LKGCRRLIYQPHKIFLAPYFPTFEHLLSIINTFISLQHITMGLTRSPNPQFHQFPSPFEHYIRFAAYTRPINEYFAPWIILEPILRPDENLQQIGIGSYVELVDGVRSLKGKTDIYRRGRLSWALARDDEYVIFILETHNQGSADIYGSHHKNLRVAFPIDLVHLNPINRLYTRLQHKKSHGQFKRRLCDEPWTKEADGVE